MLTISMKDEDSFSKLHSDPIKSAENSIRCVNFMYCTTSIQCGKTQLTVE
jgi:hypothetical protein